MMNSVYIRSGVGRPNSSKVFLNCLKNVSLRNCKYVKNEHLQAFILQKIVPIKLVM